MEKDQCHVTKRILDLTLEIIYLLTGENYGPTKNILDPSAPSLIPARRNKIILEVVNEILELLTGEELECGEGQENPSKRIKMEDQPLPTPTDGSRKWSPPGRWARPLYSQGYPQEEDKISQACQVDDLVTIKVEVDDETYLSSGERCAEEETSPKINPDGCFTRDRMQEGPVMASDDDNDMRADFSGGAPNVNPGLHSAPNFFIHVARRGGRTFNLPKDDESFPQTSGLSSNQTSHTGERSLPGSMLNAKWPGHHQQQRSHHKNTQFSCFKCNRRFKCRSYLLAHQQVHTKQKRYSGKCRRHLTGRSSLSQRYGGEKPLSCSECGKSCRQKWDLLRHLRCHTGEKPFSCADCGRRFSKKRRLIDHQRSHSGKELYSSQECGKSFGFRSSLAIHKRLHKDKGPYLCSDCGRRFTNKAHLAKHQINHLEYSCPECGKCFMQKDDFFRHKLSHKGEDAVFPSTECGKRYNSELHLARHRSGHNQGEPYSRFTEKLNLLDYRAQCGAGFSKIKTVLPLKFERDKWQIKAATHQIPEKEDFLASQTSLEGQRKIEGDRSYSCLECGECFAEVLALVEHHKNHTRPPIDQGVFCCLECGKVFSHQASLDVHLGSHKEEKPFPCSECGQCFVEKAALLVHQQTHAGKKPPLKVAERQNKVALPRPVGERTSQKSQEGVSGIPEEITFNCFECSQHFVEKSALVKHQKTHKANKAQSKVVKCQVTRRIRPAFCCQQCGAGFGSQYSLDDHLKRHADEDTPYVCPECGLCFMGMSSLQQHQRTHIGKKPRPYYKRKKPIAQSLRLLSPDDGDLETFSCEDCGKCFTNKSSLRKHYRTHTGEKPFPCLECGKSFSQSSSLAVHRRRHRGEKNYSCLECGKSFIRKADVDRHLISHTGERNFTCAQCGKCYTQLSALIAHRKVHAGVMPHSCSECGKCFTERWMLVRHEKTHTKK